jgi:hypothetical protein
MSVELVDVKDIPGFLPRSLETNLHSQNLPNHKFIVQDSIFIMFSGSLVAIPSHLRP